ncbi:MAG: SGNH/GDSL hydrolase family protein [Limisphaerales bacterium]
MRWLPQSLWLSLILLLAVWVGLPAGAVVGFCLTAAALIVRSIPPRLARTSLARAAVAVAWAGSLTIWVSTALARVTFDVYYAALAGMIAVAVWLVAGRESDAIWKARWNALVMAWLFCGAFAWLGAGYFNNRSGTFFAGLAAALAALGLCRVWFQWGPAGIQVLNTLILLLVALPLVDVARRPQSRIAVRPDNCRLYYSFNAAKGDPEAFGRWEEYYQSQFDRLGLEIFMPAPNTPLPFRLRPGSRGKMVACPISINSLGFRGPEFPAAKDGVYRIVALGESTTFGMTIQPADQSWPEMLEQIIRERLPTRRPVQVVNAGVPAYSIGQNLYRLTNELLSLQPDMMVSYHGANGFRLISSTVLPPIGPIPPVYQNRPVKLLGDTEHRLRMILFRKRAAQGLSSTAPASARPLDTACAAAYRELIACARAHGIRLALANFSMAVNPSSEPRVIDFYQGGGPRLSYPFIQANAIHSLLVRQLAAEHPEICLVDTHPHLD